MGEWETADWATVAFALLNEKSNEGGREEKRAQNTRLPFPQPFSWGFISFCSLELRTAAVPKSKPKLKCLSERGQSPVTTTTTTPARVDFIKQQKLTPCAKMEPKRANDVENEKEPATKTHKLLVYSYSLCSQAAALPLPPSSPSSPPPRHCCHSPLAVSLAETAAGAEAASVADVHQSEND